MRKPSALSLFGFLFAVIALGIILLPLVGPRKLTSAPSGEERTEAAPSPEERMEAFKWFGALGFPDVKGRKFIRVATGRWFQAGGNPPRNTYAHGFLLEEAGDTFKVVTLSLATETF